MTAAELAGTLGTDRAPDLIDVREPEEYAAWSIGGARNIPLSQLGAHLGEIDPGREVVVVCASGVRSCTAAEVLEAAGIRVASLAGGMEAWASVYDTAVTELGPVSIVQVRRRGKGCLSYLVGAGGEAFVVDPSAEVGRYVQEAASRGWQVTRVFDTHLHADHVSGSRALAAVTGASLHLNPADSFEPPFEALEEGQWFDLGGLTHLGVTAFAAPGHTKGSTMLEVGGRALLSGDTLFVDGVGRPDLAEQADEFAHDLYRSLHTRVMALPVDVRVLPAHYGDGVAIRPGVPVTATVGGLRSSLPQLSWNEDDFVSWASGRATPRPPNYTEIVRINMGRLHLGDEEGRRLELGPNRCAA